MNAGPKETAKRNRKACQLSRRDTSLTSSFCGVCAVRNYIAVEFENGEDMIIIFIMVLS